MERSDFVPYLIVWLLIACVTVWKTWRDAGAGLVLSYCFQLFLLYWLGGFIHALPWSDLPQTDLVFLGFKQSTFALAAFGFGALLLAPFIVNSSAIPNQVATLTHSNLPSRYIVFGAVSYFILAPTVGRLSGFNAVVAVGSQLVVVGCCLRSWNAWISGGLRPLLISLAPTLLIPLATVVVQGFLSYGVIALSTILIFTAQFFRPRWLLLLGGLCAGYMGLSGYAAYMRDRDALRASVWGGESISERMAKVQGTIETAEWFDLHNPDHLSFVDGRLNQDMLVGAAVVYLDNTGNYANGSSIIDAALAMVPRLIWPNKPSAGSGDLVSRFTGMNFEAGTSVGVGPILELYGNFGQVGVLLGFAGLGCLIRCIDITAGTHLHAGRWYEFAPWFLVGISLLNVSGSFVECSAGAVASILLASVCNRILRARERSNTKEQVPAAIPL